MLASQLASQWLVVSHTACIRRQGWMLQLLQLLQLRMWRAAG
jgi:hypothetical protein